MSLIFLSHDLSCDFGLGRGCAVFDTMHARGPVIFEWDAHFDRLCRSARDAEIDFRKVQCYQSSLVLDMPDRDAVLGFVRQKIVERGLPESVVRLTITGGQTEDFRIRSGIPYLVVNVWPVPEFSSRPLRVLIQQEVQRDFPEIKVTGLYFSAWMMSKKARRMGCDDFMYHDPIHGFSELSTGNLFFVMKEQGGAYECSRLITPSSNILKGVTRRVILKIAQCASALFSNVWEVPGNEIGGERYPFPLMKECFTTSSIRGIASIGTIVSPWGQEQHFETGEHTKTSQLQKLFAEYRDEYFKTHGA